MPVTFPRAEGALWHNWSPPLMVLHYTAKDQTPATAEVAYALANSHCRSGTRAAAASSERRCANRAPRRIAGDRCMPRRAAEGSLVMFSTELLIQTLLSGLMVGVLYALMALGITFIYSHRQDHQLGDGRVLHDRQLHPVVAVALCCSGRDWWWLARSSSRPPAPSCSADLLEPILIKPMYARPMQRRDDYATVVTIALLLMLRSLAVAIGGPNQYRPETDLPVMWVGPLPHGGRAGRRLGLCACSRSALFWICHHEDLGRPCAARRRAKPRRRADLGRRRVSGSMPSRSRSASRLPALPARCSRRCSWSIPTNGAVTTVKGFEIIVIGGLGSIPGALIGGLLLGRRREPRRGVHLLALPERLRLSAGDPGAHRPALRPVRRTRTGGVMADLLVEAEGLTKRYGGLVANDAVAMTLRAGRDPRPDRAQRRRQDHFRQRADRHRDAGCRHASVWAAPTSRALRRNLIAARGLVRSFQVARVFGNLTVRENLLVPFLAAGSPRRRARRARARRRAAARSPRWSRWPMSRASVLSGGQRMLLQACAGFMIPAVRLYVLDEPFAGINPVVKDTLIGLIQHENKRQRRDAFLIVSHEMEIIRRIVPARDRDDPGPGRRRRYARRGRAAPRGDHSLSGRARGMSTRRSLEVTDLHAGYVPGVDILRGLTLEARRERDDAGHRPERRRQVDAAARHLRHSSSPTRVA